MSSDGITIRQARIQDIKELVGLLGELFSIETDFKIDVALQERGLTRMLENGGMKCIMVAESSGRAIGMCSAQIVISTAEGGPAIIVEDMVLFTEYRGSGLGSRLLDAIEGWAIKKGATRMQLLADRNNHPALDFYEKNGWGMTQLICLRKKIGGPSC